MLSKKLKYTSLQETTHNNDEEFDLLTREGKSMTAGLANDGHFCVGNEADSYSVLEHGTAGLMSLSPAYQGLAGMEQNPSYFIEACDTDKLFSSK